QIRGAAQPRRAVVDVHDLVLTDVHDVAVVQIVTVHPPVLHINSVRAVEIFDDTVIAAAHDLAMVPADEHAVDLYVIIRRPSDHHAAWFQFPFEDGFAFERDENVSDGRAPSIPQRVFQAG